MTSQEVSNISRGWLATNSCLTCKFWWRGDGVAHNHCDCPESRLIDSFGGNNGLARRANGHSGYEVVCYNRVRGTNNWSK